MKKKSQSALFSPPGRWTGNDFLFKGGRNDITDTFQKDASARLLEGKRGNRYINVMFILQYACVRVLKYKFI